MKWHPWRYSSLLGCHVFLSLPTTDKRKREEAVNLFCSPSSLLSLFVWILADQRGGCMQTSTGCLWSPELAMHRCVCGRAHLNSLEFSYHSSAGPSDALWVSFHILLWPKRFHKDFLAALHEGVAVWQIERCSIWLHRLIKKPKSTAATVSVSLRFVRQMSHKSLQPYRNTQMNI